MKNRKTLNQIFLNFFLIFSIFLIGITGYSLIEGWGFLDSLYMTVITVTTTGFGETHPLSKSGKIFTIFLLILGFAAIGYTLSKIVQLIFESKILGRKYMDKKVEDIKNHFIVCGFGRIGKFVCLELKEKNTPFVVIDKNLEVIEKLKELGYLFVEGDASDDEILKKAGILKAKGLVSVLATDADNVFVTLTAKSLNPNVYIISRAQEEESKSKLLKAGASVVVNPYETEGTRIAELLLRPGIIEFVDIIIRDKRVDLNLEEMIVSKSSEFKDKTLGELSLRQKVNIIIVAIYKKDGSFTFNPKSDYRIEEEDRLIVLGEKKDIEETKKLCLGG